MNRRTLLPSIINDHNFSTYVEVGAAKGYTCYEILVNCPQTFVYMIDSWTKNTPVTGMEQYRKWNHNKNKKKCRKIHDKFPDRSVMIQALSSEAAEQFYDNSVDMVFIDASHSYEAALEDITLWSPKVKSNGIISGHDYNHPRFPGVTEAVNKFFGNKIHDTEIDYVWMAEL